MWRQLKIFQYLFHVNTFFLVIVMFSHFYLTFNLKLPLKRNRYERIRKAMTAKIERNARPVYGADVVNTEHNA